MDAPMLSELQDFTLDQYIKLIRYLQQNYRIIPFCDVRYEETPYLILRHDIDLSLRDALVMAKIEKDMGVRSTYFVLLSTKAYNLFEGENIAIIKKISELGHEIGLHYHPAQYRLYKQNVEKTLNIEAKILENFLGKRVRSISRHGPYDRDPFSATRKYINANHPYLRADLFIHDSDRAWVTLEGLSTLLNNPPKRVQLLIHPDNWQKDKINRQELLERHFQNLENEIQDAKKSLRQAIQEDQLVIDYDDDIKNKNFTEIDYKRVYEQKSNFNTPTLVRYYLIHSRFGWNLRKLRTKIRTNLSLKQSTNLLSAHNDSTEGTSSTKKPLVSIIITSYNYGHYLADAVKSALSQTYPNIEVIIVDDGSTDNTKDVAAQYPSQYIFQTNQGVSIAKNHGIRISRGDFFICLDGDDKLSPKYVEKTLNQILKHSSTGFIYTGSTVWNETTGDENIWMPRKLFSKYSLFAGWHGALGPILVRRKAFESLENGFDPTFAVYEDLDLCFRILSKGWKSDLVYEPIHWYRIHPNSLNTTLAWRRKITGAHIDRKFQFRQSYRKAYYLYTNTCGRLISLLRHPIEYLNGMKKKIQITIRVRSLQTRDSYTIQTVRQIQQEIDSTIDMLIEWHQSKALKKYYKTKIQALELRLNKL